MPNMSHDSLLTPLFSVSDDVYLKCDFLHPGRSHKARVARFLIDDAEARGEISPHDGSVLLERTGGNLGIALALEARVRGYELTLVTDPGYSRIKKDIARRLGAHVIDRGVSFPQCSNNGAVIEILLQDPGNKFFYLNQFQNPANPRAHEQGTGAEILSQLVARGLGRDTPVALTAGLGTGASMSGITRTLRSWFTTVLTLGVEPENCDIVNGRYAEHAFQGIAVGEPPPFVDISSLDAVISVSEEDAASAAHELLRSFGFFVGPSSAANFAAISQAKRHPLTSDLPGCVFVSVLYDRGEDYEC